MSQLTDIFGDTKRHYFAAAVVILWMLSLWVTNVNNQNTNIYYELTVLPLFSYNIPITTIADLKITKNKSQLTQLGINNTQFFLSES